MTKNSSLRSEFFRGIGGAVFAENASLRSAFLWLRLRWEGGVYEKCLASLVIFVASPACANGHVFIFFENLGRGLFFILFVILPKTKTDFVKTKIARFAHDFSWQWECGVYEKCLASLVIFGGFAGRARMVTFSFF
ncbi:hypothetical protein [Methanimicrococcus blatticola]|uniref:hypothetical protein n=1 Tax=Methanimicrococcus blatticola TaxID=91560 RepID=UPI0010621EFA|nr:hypothetical protein [Methanimicrococcus blatticola]